MVWSSITGLSPPATQRISWVLLKHPTCSELFPEILIQLVWAEAQVSVYFKHHLGNSNSRERSPNIILITPLKMEIRVPLLQMEQLRLREGKYWTKVT